MGGSFSLHALSEIACDGPFFLETICTEFTNKGAKCRVRNDAAFMTLILNQR